MMIRVQFLIHLWMAIGAWLQVTDLIWVLQVLMIYLWTGQVFLHFLLLMRRGSLCAMIREVTGGWMKVPIKARSVIRHGDPDFLPCRQNLLLGIQPIVPGRSLRLLLGQMKFVQVRLMCLMKSQIIPQIHIRGL